MPASLTPRPERRSPPHTTARAGSLPRRTVRERFVGAWKTVAGPGRERRSDEGGIPRRLGTNETARNTTPLPPSHPPIKSRQHETPPREGANSVPRRSSERAAPSCRPPLTPRPRKRFPPHTHGESGIPPSTDRQRAICCGLKSCRSPRKGAEVRRGRDPAPPRDRQDRTPHKLPSPNHTPPMKSRPHRPCLEKGGDPLPRRGSPACESPQTRGHPVTGLPDAPPRKGARFPTPQRERDPSPGGPSESDLLWLGKLLRGAEGSGGPTGEGSRAD